MPEISKARAFVKLAEARVDSDKPRLRRMQEILARAVQRDVEQGRYVQAVKLSRGEKKLFTRVLKTD